MQKRATRVHHLELALSSVIYKYGSPEQSSWHPLVKLIMISDKTAIKWSQIFSCFMEPCQFPLLGKELEELLLMPEPHRKEEE